MFILEGNTKIIQKATIYNCVTGEINLYLSDTHDLYIDNRLYDEYCISVNSKVKQIVKVNDTLVALLSVSGDLAFFGEFDPMLKGIVDPMDEKHNTPNKAAVFNIDPKLKFIRGIKKIAMFNGNLYFLKYDGELCAIGTKYAVLLNGLPVNPLSSEDYYGLKRHIQCLNTKAVDIYVNHTTHALYVLVNKDFPYPYSDEDEHIDNFAVYVLHHEYIDYKDSIRISTIDLGEDVTIDSNSTFLDIPIGLHCSPIIVGCGNIYVVANNSYFRLKEFYPDKVDYILPWYIDSASNRLMLNAYINKNIGIVTLSTRELIEIIRDSIKKEESKKVKEEKSITKKKAPPKKAKAKKEETAKEEEVKE